jgi:mono/diheme cytochrome c family protein
MTYGGLRRTLRLAAPGGLLAAILALTGCDVADSGSNLVNGKQLFIERCGSCHVLGRAETKGTAGPNLDEAFQQATADGLGRSTFEGVVHQQILHPNRFRQVDPRTGKLGPAMPADLVTGEDAEDVAAYVASAVAAGGKDSGALARVGGAQAKGTARPQDGALTIPADPSGQLIYRFAAAVAPAGALTLRSPNESAVDHNIAVEGGGLDERGPVVKNGGVSEVEVDLEAGEYTFYCSVPGHREGGMAGKLTVR